MGIIYLTLQGRFGIVRLTAYLGPGSVVKPVMKRFIANLKKSRPGKWLSWHWNRILLADNIVAVDMPFQVKVFDSRPASSILLKTLLL
jgi:hypothetical protein